MSRRRRNALLVVCVLAASFFVWLDHRHGSDTRQTISSYAPGNEDFRKYHEKTFTVVKVVDGDTVDINIGDGKYDNTRIRLLGVDTPETKKPKYEVMYFGPEASDYATRTLLNKKVTVIIDSVSDVRDKYNRLLGYIKLEDGSIFNEMLIETGHGYADLRFDHSDFDKYAKLMDQATKSNAGLWQQVKREQLPSWLKRERPRLLRDRK